MPVNETVFDIADARSRKTGMYQILVILSVCLWVCVCFLQTKPADMAEAVPELVLLFKKY